MSGGGYWHNSTPDPPPWALALSVAVLVATLWVLVRCV